MTITAVSTLPKPAQSTAPDDTASTEAPADQGFASLLSSHLLSEELLQATIVEDLPEPELSQADTSSLLATLGMIVPQTNPATDAVDITDANTSILGTVSRVTTDAQSLQSLHGNTENGTALDVGSLSSSDQPAIFADATPLGAKSENIGGKDLGLTEALTNLSPTIGTGAQNNSSAPTVQREGGISTAIPTSIQSQNWTEDFGQKIVWLAAGDKHSAQLTLNPPHMGSIEVSLNVDKGNATASFTSANAEVRDSIESALPRLREMFASAGIELGQTNVSAESFRQQAEHGEANRNTSRWASDNAILVGDSVAVLAGGVSATHQGIGLVDTFA